METKPCAVCGREITWRRKWARDWDQVKYCSRACRSRGLTERATALEREILALLATRRGGASVCPSEVARKVAGHEGEDGWRALMEPVRQAARRLVARGELVITQKGRVVEPSRARGPIRLRRP